MIFYILVIVVTTGLAWLCAHTKGNERRVIYIILIAFPSFIAGLRGVGTDYNMYIINFSDIINGDFPLIDYNSIMVQAFILLGKLGGDAQLSIFLVSLLTIWLAFHIIFLHKKDINTTFAVFSYMTTFYLTSFNLFRQMLAAEIFLLASINLFEKDNKKRFWIYFILASLVHSAVIPFILVYFFRNVIAERAQRKTRILVYLVSSIIVLIMPQLATVMGKLAVYIPHYAWFLTRFGYSSLGVGAFRYIILAIFPVILVSRPKYIASNDYCLISYMPFYAILGTILWFTSYITAATLYRSSYMFLVALPILHGYIFKNNLKNHKGVIVLLIGVLLLLLCWYDCAFLNSGEIYPYKMCF